MRTKKDTIKYLFNIVYNHGRLVDLIIPFSRIKELDDAYKRNYNKFATFEDFENNLFQTIKDIKKSKSAYSEIKKQFSLKLALQPSVLTECFVAQTLANHLNLDKYIDFDTTTQVPTQLLGATFSRKGSGDGYDFRYCYYDDNFDTLLFQCGASGTVDIVFTKYKISIRVEIKEQVSKLEECDITGLYDEQGKLHIDNKFIVKRTKYIPFVNLFNNLTNIFDTEGHNFSFSRYLNNERAREIVSDSLGIKNVDLFILVIGNTLVPTLSNYLFDFVTFEGSEIRPAGRNYKKYIFTPNFAKLKLEALGGVIESKNIVKMPYNSSNLIKGRNQDTYNRYGIGSLLFVKLDFCKIEGDLIKFDFYQIYQKIPSISIHLNAFINKASLSIQHNKLN